MSAESCGPGATLRIIRRHELPWDILGSISYSEYAKCRMLARCVRYLLSLLLSNCLMVVPLEDQEGVLSICGARESWAELPPLPEQTRYGDRPPFS